MAFAFSTPPRLSARSFSWSFIDIHPSFKPDMIWRFDTHRHLGCVYLSCCTRSNLQISWFLDVVSWQETSWIRFLHPWSIVLKVLTATESTRAVCLFLYPWSINPICSMLGSNRLRSYRQFWSWAPIISSRMSASMASLDWANFVYSFKNSLHWCHSSDILVFQKSYFVIGLVLQLYYDVWYAFPFSGSSTFHSKNCHYRQCHHPTVYTINDVFFFFFRNLLWSPNYSCSSGSRQWIVSYYTSRSVRSGFWPP